MQKIIYIILLSLIFTGCSNTKTTGQEVKQSFNVQEQLQDITTTDYTREQEETSELIVETETQSESNIKTIDASEKEIETFNLINKIRAENGLNELTWDNELYYYSSIRSKEASVKWSHIRPDGTSWKEMNPDVLQGENLAKGYYNASEAVDAWMDSQGHKENILRENFTRTAIAFYETENGWFWCEVFGY